MDKIEFADGTWATYIEFNNYLKDFLIDNTKSILKKTLLPMKCVPTVI